MSKQTLYILVGISGAGKSTYARKLAVETDSIVVSSDEIRGEVCGDPSDQSKNGFIFNVLIPQRVMMGLENGRSVIFDATSLTPKDRKAIMRLASESVRKECHYFEPDLEKSLSNQSKRDRQVPSWVVEKQFKKFVRPTYEEGFHVILCINPNPRIMSPKELKSILSENDYVGLISG